MDAFGNLKTVNIFSISEPGHHLYVKKRSRLDVTARYKSHYIDTTGKCLALIYIVNGDLPDVIIIVKTEDQHELRIFSFSEHSTHRTFLEPGDWRRYGAPFK